MEIKSDKPYFENLDALRFFAFLCVFCSHCVGFYNFNFSNKYLELIHKHFFLNGNLGVSFFFVLSGFLITWLLYIEKAKNNKINALNFYMRRVLRIWPVYFLVVFIGFVIGTCFSSALLDSSGFPYHIDISRLKWYLAFLANYDLIINEISSVLLSVLWSVAVEEQYYAVWPLVFLVFKNKKALPFTCYAIIIISFICRINHTRNTNFSTFEVMSDLAVGGLIAYYCLTREAFMNYFKNISKLKIIIVYALFFVSVPLKGFSHIFGEKVFTFYYPFEALIFSAFFAFILMEQSFADNSVYKFGRINVFTYLGKISYGLYAYHMLFFPVAFYVAHNMGLVNNELSGYMFKVVFSLVLTIIFSYLSFAYYEKKILYFKKYFGS